MMELYFMVGAESPEVRESESPVVGKSESPKEESESREERLFRDKDEIFTVLLTELKSQFHGL